jgi:hypothetical protein
MKSQSLAAICMLLPMAAQADDVEKVVQYSCERKADLVRIEYVATFPSSNKDAGKALPASTERNAWNTWDLLVVDDARGLVKRVKTVSRHCSLSDGPYVVTVIAVPGNGNLNGNCGAWTTATANISHAGKRLISVQFEKSCNDVDTPVITGVVVHAGGISPEKTTVRQKDFYRN